MNTSISRFWRPFAKTLQKKHLHTKVFTPTNKFERLNSSPKRDIHTHLFQPTPTPSALLRQKFNLFAAGSIKVS